MDLEELYRDGRSFGVGEDEALELAEAIDGLVGIDSVHALSDRVCRISRRLLGAEGSTFVLSEGEEVYYAEESAEDRLWRGRRFPATACISGWAIRNDQATAVRDVYEDARIPAEAYRPTFVRSLAMAPMQSEAGPTGALGVYWSHPRDTSERELFALRALAAASAKALRQARLLEECRRLHAAHAAERQSGPSGSALSRLLPAVAHDLRTPLSAVAYGAEILEQEDLSPAGRAALRQLRSSSRRADRMVGQLVDYSAIEFQGGLPLRLSASRLDGLAEQVVAEMRSSGAGGELTVEAEPASGLWDGDRLIEAVENLVRNAFEHGERDSPVTVKVTDGERFARVAVHNWGGPIPEEDRERLFEPFRSVERHSGSIGLGLFITDQIARGHGGRVEIESAADTGTTFTLVLPKDPAIDD